MTDESIELEEFDKPLNEMLKNRVKERLEKIMEAEREAFLSEENPKTLPTATTTGARKPGSAK
ncbi:hypothetical protein K9M78_01065 [Candidatus Bipolaricaulota bacterium]|nr:hypothetical protein [Candidatus Bipolaricaulota bacterium]